jgi:hypothetical protein
MIHYISKLYSIIFKSNASSKMWGIYHSFIIMLDILSFPFLNHVLEFYLFKKMTIEILLNEKKNAFWLK